MYSIEVSSMTTFAFSDPNCKSSEFMVSSISSLYWKPLQPPPSTTTLRKDPSVQISLSRFAHESLSFSCFLTSSERTCGVVDKNMRLWNWFCEILEISKENQKLERCQLVTIKDLTLATPEKHYEPLFATHLGIICREKVELNLKIRIAQMRKICQKRVWHRSADCQRVKIYFRLFGV